MTSATAAPPGEGFAQLPPPAKYTGRFITDTTTGTRYRSDGQRWVEQ